MDWKDKKADEMTLEEAREAVKELRRFIAKEDNPEPALFASRNRIIELSKAITKDQSQVIGNICDVRKWATEILYHCEIMEKC